MTEVIDVTDHDVLLELIGNNETVVIDFQAKSWCVPCQRLAPHYDTAARNSDATFVTVDIDEAPWAMVEYGVQAVPTLMLYRNGEYVKNLKERTVVKLLSEINS